MIAILKKQVLGLNPCTDGVLDFLKTEANEQAFEVFFKYIDFCLARNFPDKEQLKQLAGQFENGIIVDRKYVLKNPERIAVLGKSDIELNCSGFAVTRAYVKHDSVLYVNACDNAYVVVDALDNASVVCSIKDKARVIVNLYGDASSTNATKVNIKNKQTYDLQVK